MLRRRMSSPLSGRKVSLPQSADFVAQPGDGGLDTVGPGVAETEAYEVPVAASRSENEAGRDADAILYRIVEQGFRIDGTRQLEPEDRTADRSRSPRVGGEVFGDQRVHALGILPEYGPEGLQIAVVIAARQEFGQRQLLEQSG